MKVSEKRVVITGQGVVSPLGTGNDVFWRNLSAGKSGVAKVQAFDADGLDTQLAAEVKDFDPKSFVKQRKSLKVMARDIQLAVGAAELALSHSKLDPTHLDPTRFGVNFGAALIASELDELGHAVEHSMNGTKRFDLKQWGKKGIEQLFPLWMLKYLPNMPACHISIIHNAQGPNNSITAGEASSALAIGEAARIIARGQADIFLAGGTDSKIHPLIFVRFGLLGRTTKRRDDPSKASRPFDADRDGLVLGEGSAVFVMEDLEHARSRRARILGEVIGFGSSCQPRNKKGAILAATRRAMDDAGLRPEELGHIVASGVSTVPDDLDEALALKELLGTAAAQVPIVAYKSYLGFLGAGAGAVDLAASLLGIEHGTLLGTLNFDRPDPAAQGLRITRETSDLPKGPILKYDLAQTGQCAALVVRPFVE